MKLSPGDHEKLRYHLRRPERSLLLTVLERYPLIPPAHQRLSRSMASEPLEHGQQLLDEALAEQRRENRDRVKTFLQDPERFRETETGWQLILSPADREWLLQVLNDVRVGSWIKLGSPEADDAEIYHDFELAPDAWIMEMAGRFQLVLLESPD